MALSWVCMKKDIHPNYFPEANVICACGNSFTVGATKPEIRVEICAKCHPFYTGEEKLLDVAGRVEKFKARREKASATPKKRKKVRSQEREIKIRKNPRTRRGCSFDVVSVFGIIET